MLKKLIFAILSFAIILSACDKTNLSSIPSTPSNIEQTETSENILNSTPDRFAKVNPNLYRGGVPDETDMKYLKSIGIKTFISFRGEAIMDEPESIQIEQEKLISEKLNVNFLNLPVPLDKPISDSMIKEFFATIENPENQPVYVHCFHGRDRTGAMIALYRIKNEGIIGIEALKDMQSYGFIPEYFPIFTNQVLNSTTDMLNKL